MKQTQVNTSAKLRIISDSGDMKSYWASQVRPSSICFTHWSKRCCVLRRRAGEWGWGWCTWPRSLVSAEHGGLGWQPECSKPGRQENPGERPGGWKRAKLGASGRSPQGKADMRCHSGGSTTVLRTEGELLRRETGAWLQAAPRRSRADCVSLTTGSRTDGHSEAACWAGCRTGRWDLNRCCTGFRDWNGGGLEGWTCTSQGDWQTECSWDFGDSEALNTWQQAMRKKLLRFKTTPMRRGFS